MKPLSSLADALLPPFLLALVVIVPSVGLAIPITFDFTGTASIHTGVWAGQGTAVTGSYTYDTDLADTLPTSATFDKFVSNNGANAGLSYGLTITLGAQSITLDETDGLFNFTVIDSTTDQYSFSGPSNVAHPGVAALQLFGSDPTAVQNLTGVAPTTAPDLSLFASPASAGRVGTALKFSIDSITERGAPSSPIPEPSAALVYGFGIVVAASVTRRRRLD